MSSWSIVHPTPAVKDTTVPKPYRLNNMNKAAFRTTVLTATLGVLVLALFACVNEPPSQVEPCGSGQEKRPFVRTS